MAGNSRSEAGVTPGPKFPQRETTNWHQTHFEPCLLPDPRSLRCGLRSPREYSKSPRKNSPEDGRRFRWGGGRIQDPYSAIAPPPASDQFDPHSPPLAFPTSVRLPLSSHNGPFHHPPKTLVYPWAAAES